MPATAIRVPLLGLRLARLDDDRLAALAAGGEERAFEALYDRHHRALLGFCRHMVGSREEAEDALQQTFLRAHRALLSRGAPEEVRPWLFAIARNRCLTLLASRRGTGAAEEAAEPATEGLGAEVERRADLRALLGDIERLPEEQRAALVLAELADLPHAEIAGVIGVPPGKVKALVHQARTRLIADREAREAPCERVREQLATARGGELRRGPLRRHLNVCEPCREYRAAVAEQRAALGLVLPVLPSAGLKDAILGALTGGGGSAAAAGGTGALAAGGAAAVSSGGGTGLAAKLAVGAALVGGAGGGGAVLVEEVSQRPEAPSRAASAVPTPAKPPGDGPARRTPVALADDAPGESERRSRQARSRSRGVPSSRSGAWDERAAEKSDRREQRAAAKERRAVQRERKLERDPPGRARRPAMKEKPQRRAIAKAPQRPLTKTPRRAAPLKTPKAKNKAAEPAPTATATPVPTPTPTPPPGRAKRDEAQALEPAGQP